MKSFNEVKAGAAGKIVRFLVENEDAVMAGQPISCRPAMQWRVNVDGPKCRFLVFGQLVLGEKEFAHAGWGLGGDS